jgi:hypothetical protein
MTRPLLLIALLTFVSATPFEWQREFDEQISWGLCPSGVPDGLNCSKLSVPVDWNNPDGERFHLEIAVLNATDSAKRLGYLMVNPGGPGRAAILLLTAYLAGAWY